MRSYLDSLKDSFDLTPSQNLRAGKISVRLQAQRTVFLREKKKTVERNSV